MIAPKSKRKNSQSSPPNQSIKITFKNRGVIHSGWAHFNKTSSTNTMRIHHNLTIFKLVINLLSTVGVPKNQLYQENVKLETTSPKGEKSRQTCTS